MLKELSLQALYKKVHRLTVERDRLRRKVALADERDRLFKALADLVTELVIVDELNEIDEAIWEAAQAALGSERFGLW